MRVLFVSMSLQIGGVETQMVRLARELKASGHDVRVLLIEEGGPLEADLLEAAVPYEVVPFGGIGPRHPWRSIRDTVAVFRAVRRARADVVQASISWAYMLAMPFARWTHVPVTVATRLCTWDQVWFRRRWQLRLHRSSVGYSDVVLANSRQVARDAVEREGVDPAKVEVIENGLDLPAVGADVRRQPAVGMMVANLLPVKDHRTLLEALALLPDPPRVVLVGEGPERRRLEQLTHELALDGSVEFRGRVPNAAELFGEAQFALLTSRSEGLPNVIGEAMSYGLPVVATDVGGVADLVRDGSTGLLVPPGDPAALAKAIDRIANDPDLRERLGRAGREVVEPYGWASSVDRHLALYRRIASRSGIVLGDLR